MTFKKSDYDFHKKKTPTFNFQKPKANSNLTLIQLMSECPFEASVNKAQTQPKISQFSVLKWELAKNPWKL